MMTVIPGLATAASRATAAAGRDPHSASRGPAVVKANAFLTVDGDHVRVAEDGGIVYDRDAEGSFTVTARSGWLVEGRETLTVPYSAERPRALKVTGLTGEDGTEVPVEPDDEEEPEEEEDYTLSIKCDRYLGLDRTDSGRLGHTVKTATATLDPECEGATVTWISCGSLCEFVEGDRVVTKPTGWTVSYRNKDPDTPSTEVDAEELVAEVTIPGKDGTIRASKRFTVVKVDVSIKGKPELEEEPDGSLVQFAKDPANDKDVNVVEEWTNRLVSVDFEVAPMLPETERVIIRCPSNFLYVKSSSGYVIADMGYAVADLCATNFYLHGHEHMDEDVLEFVAAVHEESGACDKAAFSCFLLDLDIDSDNDLEIEGNDDFEDKIENLWPGKILAVDGQGISNGVDYVAKMRVRLEGGLADRICKVRIVASGLFRLYADETRKTEITTDSLMDMDVIVPQKTFFLDGVKEGRGSVRFELIDDDGVAVGHDEVKVLVIPTVSRAPGRSQYAAMWAPTDMMDGIATMEDYLKEAGFKDIVWYTPGFWGGVGSCTYDNFKEMANNGVIGISSHGDVGQYPAIMFHNDQAGLEAVRNWVDAADRSLSSSWICICLTADREKVAVWIYQPWFEKFWKPSLDRFDAIVAWETCFSSSYLDYCGGRVALGFESGTTGPWAEGVWKNIFGRMDGRVAAGSARMMKTAFEAAAGQWKSDRGENGDVTKMSDLTMRGNAYTTLCPAPMQNDAFFPQQGLPDNSDAFGCVIFDTYLSPCHAAARVVSVAGAGACDFVWLRQSPEEPPYGVGFKVKKGTGLAKVTCYGEQALNDGNLGGRYSDLDLVGPNGHNREWEF